MTLRIAAVGDVHLGTDARGRLRPALETVAKQADVLLLAGASLDTAPWRKLTWWPTSSGTGPSRCSRCWETTTTTPTPKTTLPRCLEKRGVRVLEGCGEVLDVGGYRLGVAGAKGFGGGFAGKCGSAFEEREMTVFIEHSDLAAARLADALRTVRTPMYSSRSRTTRMRRGRRHW